MSLSRQCWRERPVRKLTALAMLVCAVQWLGASQAVAAELTIVSAGTSRTDGLVSLVVDVRSAASEPISPESFSVTASTLPHRFDAVPLFSDQLAVGVVVDGSEDGRAALQAGLAGAANFVLEQPLTGAAVVADKSPPIVMSTAEAKPADAVGALSAIDAGGQRQTSEALSVALGVLERIPARSRMVVLHTAAADAGGESATDLAAKLIDAHAALAVISTSPDTSYWLDVTRRTGGVLTTPETGSVFAAFDQVADAMRSRYLLTFAPTDQPPFAITVRVDTAEGSATADAVVLVPPADPDSGPGWPLLLPMAGLLAVVGLVFFVLIRRTPRAVASADVGSGGGPLGRRLAGLGLPGLPELSRLARRPRRTSLPGADSALTTPQPPQANAPTSADPLTAPIKVNTSTTAPNATAPSTGAPNGPDTAASTRNGAAPPTKAANGTDLPAAPSPPDPSTNAPNKTDTAAAEANGTDQPNSTDTPPAPNPTDPCTGSPTAAETPTRAANGTDTAKPPNSTIPSTGAPTETDPPANRVDPSTDAPDLADTHTPPRPRPPRPSASTPPQDRNVDRPHIEYTCVCGCGRKTHPGRAFINSKHQGRWMSQLGRSSR